MDDSGHRENGRQKQQPQGQWLMQHHPSMKQIIAIMAERDAALQERNLAISEKKAALAERDLAILQRDSAIAERNSAIMERDNTIAALQYRESALSSGNISSCPPGCQVSHGVKHIHHPHQQHLQHHQSHMEESSYMSRDLQISEGPPVSPIASEPAKSRQTKRPKEEKPKAPKKKPSKPSKKVKKEGEDLNKMMFSHDWGMEDDQNKQLAVSKPNDWKGQDLGLNQVTFDESMPVPVCSCTGVLRPCYRWGSGGWQSSCCTTTVSMYPLPAAPNKRHARVGGRKMSGNVFTKLLNRLASEGHDLSRPVDLKEHWAKHGTNRYITIK